MAAPRIGVTQSGVGGAITVVGVDETIAKFRAVASIAGRRMGFITYSTALAIERGAKNRIHSVSGNLASGVKIVKLGPYTWAVSASSLDGSIEGKNQKEYAPYVEYGTRKMAARPFMRPAFLSNVGVANLQLKILAQELQRL